MAVVKVSSVLPGVVSEIVARSYFDVVGKSEGIDLSALPSLAVQASKDECDINTIVKKYLRTGELPGLRQMVYADISEMRGLQESMNMVIAAEEAFMALPADVRAFFDHSPVKMAEFSADAGNYEQALKLGLVRANPPSQPVSQPPEGGPNP